MTTAGCTLVASDWHLGHFSSASAARLARAFLERAGAAGHDVILNGDIFEGLFEPVADAERAHPDVHALIVELTAAGRLRRTEGNHDPGAGPPSIVLAHETLGRVLVMHGHAADPLHGSAPLRVGDAISRRFGRLAVVRGAARLAEHAAGLASARVEARFRARCLAALDRAGCAFGIFGHVHRQRLTTHDRYANAGRLRPASLEYLALTRYGAEARCLSLEELRTEDGFTPGAREVACSRG